MWLEIFIERRYIHKRKLSFIRCFKAMQVTSEFSFLCLACERYAAVNCYNWPPNNSTWMANGCEYSCNAKTLKHKIIRPSWCQTISKATRCAVCPGTLYTWKILLIRSYTLIVSSVQSSLCMVSCQIELHLNGW